MKINKFFMGLCGVMAFSMASCSNDEPVNNGPEQPDQPTGEVAYMNVRLNDVNQGSRTITDGGTENGNKDEHKVNSAKFFFFDDNGGYAGMATPWNGGHDYTGEGEGDHPSDGTTGNNIEFQGNTVVILDNVTGTEYPSYVMTVLNAPDFTAEGTMKATAEKLANWESSDGFVMSTSSYYDDGTDAHHGNANYYVTKVTANDFYTSAEAAEKTNQPVDIYVERLAAKAQLIGKNEYPIEATVFGNDNANETGDNVGKTNMKVKINGWALSNTIDNSYMSKNLDGWYTNNTVATIFDKWNDGDNHRSYWAKSVTYSDANASSMTRLSWIELSKQIGDADYCNENTKANFDNLYADATSLLIAATVTDEKDKPLDLVRYKGLLFNKADYFKYVLNSISASGNLNYWLRTSDETTEETDENGETSETHKYGYTQLGTSQIIFDLVEAEGVAGDRAIAEIQEVTLPVGNTTIYTKGADGKFTETATTAEEIKAALADYVEMFGAVEAYNGGAMYYSIPIEHLAATKDAAVAEGYYGVVRNHWYNLTINNVEKLGHGVFTPGTGSGEDVEPGKPIIPEDPDELYYLDATINVLSWRIVNQTVDL